MRPFMKTIPHPNSSPQLAGPSRPNYDAAAGKGPIALHILATDELIEDSPMTRTIAAQAGAQPVSRPSARLGERLPMMVVGVNAGSGQGKNQISTQFPG